MQLDRHVAGLMIRPEALHGCADLGPQLRKGDGVLSVRSVEEFGNVGMGEGRAPEGVILGVGAGHFAEKLDDGLGPDGALGGGQAATFWPRTMAPPLTIGMT
jgi:hypothetical protein